MQFFAVTQNSVVLKGSPVTTQHLENAICFYPFSPQVKRCYELKQPKTITGPLTKPIFFHFTCLGYLQVQLYWHYCCHINNVPFGDHVLVSYLKVISLVNCVKWLYSSVDTAAMLWKLLLCWCWECQRQRSARKWKMERKRMAEGARVLTLVQNYLDCLRLYGSMPGRLISN